jgi:hypothetical protein
MLLKKFILQLTIVFILISLSSCNYTTYSPRTKHQKHLAQPSLVLVQRIVDYREKFNSWPLSKEEFISKDSKYREAFLDFPYQYIRFDAKDIDHMTFFFDQHIKDVENYSTNQKVDLNAYRGEVKFYKEDGKFLWKIKMY